VSGRSMESITLRAEATVREAMQCIDGGLLGIALVVDDRGTLIGTVTDGDIRRAMLADASLDEQVALLLDRQAALQEDRPMPLTAPVGTPASELIALMRRYEVRQIPIVDGERRPTDVVLLHELIGVEGPALRAVVMAGGLGTRLGDLTAATPKPMLPVGDRPLLERIVEQLREAGIRHVNFTTHYQAEVIAAHFGDGSAHGVEIEYVSEERPLGTAGALGLVQGDDPILVMNGDILTRVDFGAMHRFHEEHRADMTVAVRPYEARVPYGIVELEGSRVSALTEKPLLRGFVNAGIYLINPDVRSFVEPGEQLDMPQLIDRLLDGGRNVVGFPLREYWLDIGAPADYEQALKDVERL
jgi:dTDP-glucose pyrophosphorylase/CBS domain-containing protein